MVRRAERGLGVAIRKGQDEGQIARRGDIGARGGTPGCTRGEHLDRPGNYFQYRDEITAVYRLTDGVTDEQFDQAIEQARAEGGESAIRPHRRPGSVILALCRARRDVVVAKIELVMTGAGWPMMEPLPKKESGLLAATLNSGETVLGQMVGEFGQTAVATNQRLIIVKSGFMVGATFGGRTTSFDYRNITAVEVRTSLASGYFEVTAGGMTLPNATGVNNKIRQQELPNVVSFAKSARAGWDGFAGKVREMCQTPGAASPVQAQPINAVSIPEQIAQLGELHKAGVLSDDEFTAKKAELLARM